MKKIAPILAICACLTASTISTAQCPTSDNIHGVHIVQPKETLYGISRKFHVSVAQLCQWNSLSLDDILKVCTTLKVASNIAVKEPGSTPTTKPVPNTYSTSTRKPIPSTYSTNTYAPPPTINDNPPYQPPSPQVETFNDNSSNNSLTSNNNNSSTTNQNGLVGTPNYNYLNSSPFVPFYHVVSYGETVQGVANQYDFPVEKLMMMNNLPNLGTLSEGQKLVLESTEIKTNPYILEKTTPSQPTTNQATYQPYNQPTNPTTPNPSDNNTQGAHTSMTMEEQDMITEINLVRGNPAGYIPYINAYINELKNDNLNNNSNEISTSQELIAELRNTPTLSILAPSQCIYTAAMKHGEDQRARGVTDHKGSDGSYPWDRVRRECSSLQDGNENLVGGPESIRRAVILLLVDDGIEGRGHRKTMLNPLWKYVACYKVGTIGDMPNVWVQNYGY